MREIRCIVVESDQYPGVAEICECSLKAGGLALLFENFLPVDGYENPQQRHTLWPCYAEDHGKCMLVFGWGTEQWRMVLLRST